MNKSLILLLILVICLMPVCTAGSQSVQCTVKPTIGAEITDGWDILNYSNVPIDIYKINGNIYLMTQPDTWQKVDLT